MLVVHKYELSDTEGVLNIRGYKYRLCVKNQHEKIVAYFLIDSEEAKFDDFTVNVAYKIVGTGIPFESGKVNNEDLLSRYFTDSSSYAGTVLIQNSNYVFHVFMSRT